MPGDDRITRAAGKATGISRRPPGPGERLFGEGFGTLTDRLARLLSEGSFAEEPGPADLLMAGLPLSRTLRFFAGTRGAPFTKFAAPGTVPRANPIMGTEEGIFPEFTHLAESPGAARSFATSHGGRGSVMEARVGANNVLDLIRAVPPEDLKALRRVLTADELSVVRTVGRTSKSSGLPIAASPEDPRFHDLIEGPMSRLAEIYPGIDEYGYTEQVLSDILSRRKVKEAGFDAVRYLDFPIGVRSSRRSLAVTDPSLIEILRNYLVEPRRLVHSSR